MFWVRQAQPQFQLQLGWVSFIVDFPHHISCATTTTILRTAQCAVRNHHHISCATTTRASSEIAGNDQNLLTIICWSTLVKLKIIEFFGKMEDELCISTLAKPNTIFGSFDKKTTSMDDNLNKICRNQNSRFDSNCMSSPVRPKSGIQLFIIAQPQLTCKFDSELGTALPQLFIIYSLLIGLTITTVTSPWVDARREQLNG